jgi:hypothetical protein
MAKLYCIFAREAGTAVIFRRGPSKHVRLITWDLKTHTFTPGQWFNGRIYADKADLSPDGTKLVYFAAKHHLAVHPELSTWVAVSTPPFLTAHVLWSKIGTWDGLSLFENNAQLALGTYRSDSSLTPHDGFELPKQLSLTRRPWPGYFFKFAEHDRLIRDGWIVQAGDPLYRSKILEQVPVIYRKSGAAKLNLQLAAKGASAGDYYFELCDDSGNAVALKADWADVRGGVVYYSQGGKLFRMCPPGPAIELADFTDMTFENIEAPDWAKVW